MTATILTGDCRVVLASLPESSVHSCVTDPPYGLNFMGKAWDYDVPPVETWREVLRVLKPGGHLLAFAGSRTYHRMVVAIEDAGFEIRDQIMWLYGSGFPKSHDVSKGIDAAAGAKRDVVGVSPNWRDSKRNREKEFNSMEVRGDNAGLLHGPPVTNAARQWEGWGTALKPSAEPVVIAQKPLPDMDIICKIGSKIDFLGGCLWSMLSANVAARLSVSNPSASVAASAFAQWSADGRFSTQAVSSAQMDMSQSEWVIVSSLSIVSSWRSTLAAALRLSSTSTIGTECATKTDWRTLNSCLSHLTPNIIIQAQTVPGGLTANANVAIRYFSGELSRLSATLELSAQETATGNPATFSLDADARPYNRPIVVARKPFPGTVAANVIQHGTGALNIDGCRVAIDPDADASQLRSMQRSKRDTGDGWGMSTVVGDTPQVVRPEGRWPANVIHDGSEEVLAGFPNAPGQMADASSSAPSARTSNVYGAMRREGEASADSDNEGAVGFKMKPGARRGDSGSAARFFYCAKASKADRDEGLTTPEQSIVTFATANGTSGKPSSISEGLNTAYRNNHPTVKPTDLMRYLCRLVTPPGGTVLDPFMGSGSTGKAARLEQFSFVGIEIDPAYVEIARARIDGDAPLLAVPA